MCIYIYIYTHTQAVALQNSSGCGCGWPGRVTVCLGVSRSARGRGRRRITSPKQQHKVQSSPWFGTLKAGLPSYFSPEERFFQRRRYLSPTLIVSRLPALPNSFSLLSLLSLLSSCPISLLLLLIFLSFSLPSLSRNRSTTFLHSHAFPLLHGPHLLPLRGWRNAVGNQIEICWLRKNDHEPQSIGICVKQRGTTS